ncbi:MAG: MBL fold metallo-hydrolase [Thermoflexia bacterium]|nr:MAG: MBL fold metallo-hydrolase [Thermoflexia bacterium]
MLQERVSSDIYLFTSDLYAQVTAGLIVTPEGAVLIDTMPFPLETEQILQFLTRRSTPTVRYLIFTHYHADHIYGASLFPGTPILAHARCREHLLAHGEEGLAAARAEVPDLLESVVLRLPDITLDNGEALLQLGEKTLQIFWAPGHSDDGIAIYVREDQVLFAGDALTPVPTVVDGDPNLLKATLERFQDLEPDTIVRGHGEVILRGEVQESLRTAIRYLDLIQEIVAEAIATSDPRQRDVLLRTDIEKCGISRVALGGEAPRLHAANLRSLYNRLLRSRAEQAPRTPGRRR